MFSRLPGATGKEWADYFRRSLGLAAISFLLWVTGCSGMPVPPSGNTVNTNNSVSGLTVFAVLPPASVGSSYAATVKVSGGTSPYTFSLASGQLPAGVTLGSSSGMISGTPSQTGSYGFAISVSDSSGLSKQQPLQIQVSSTSSGGGGNSFSNLQNSGGWAGYGQGPPSFVDCSPSPCDGITYSMVQGIQAPSMSGQAAQYNLGGTAVYSDALFNNHLIGDGSSQGLLDSGHVLVPTYHDFTYDVYFYGSDLSLSQAVEFDINQFFGGMGFIWGHECRIAGGNEWDIWDNLNQHWVPTGVPCYPNSNAWNHVTIQVQRTANNQLLYESISLNGVSHTVNQYYNPGSAVGWYGITINYQMDGNYMQSPYSIYLDNLTFTYQ